MPYYKPLAILLMFSFHFTFAQGYLFDVQIINVEDGLPNRRVLNVTQDKEGFIWISTPGKISRYDGLQFKTYDSDFLHIPEYSGVSMAFDKENNLWYCVKIGSKEIIHGGVINIQQDSVYNLETFTNNQFKSKEIIDINLSATSNSEWFLTTQQGKVYKYQGFFEEIYQCPKPLTNRLRGQAHQNGSYWIMHQNELINVVNQQPQQILQPLNKQYPKFINKIVQQQPHLIIEELHPFRGLQYWILKEGEFILYTPTNYQNEEIFGLFHISADYTVFATREELVIQDTSNNIIFKFNEFNASILGVQRIKSNGVFLDRQHILWLATDNGLIKILQKKNPFLHYSPKNSTRGIYLDEQHQLWIGGYNGNNQYDLITRQKTKAIKSSTLDRVPIMGFSKDSKGHLWVGTTKSLLLEYIPNHPQPIEHPYKLPYSLYLPFENPRTKTLWVGTNHGLLYFDRTKEQFFPYEFPITSLNLEVRHFYLNQKGLWIVTNKGIFLIDGTTEKLIKYYGVADGLPHLNFTHLHEDKRGIFWLASKGGGLIRWNQQKNEFTQFNQEKGLSNNVIYAVYEDEYENLWLPSNYGLNCFDKNTLITQVYLPQNGISHEEFNTFSHFKAADGTLYFGGLNGVTSFHPKDVLKNETVSTPLYLTKVRILEEEQAYFTDKTTAFQQKNSIELSPSNRILELELSLLDFAQSEKNQYAYRIAGYQEQWIYTKENKISLINLPYGKYTLELKGRGASGNWSAKRLAIPLLVKRPIYLQTWFVILIIIMLIFGILVLFKWRLSRLESDRKRLEREVKKRTRQIEADKTTIMEQATALQELNKAKTRFFANISHEFRTPLTLIIGPLQQMLQQPKAMITPRRLKGMLSNAQNMLKLINQLLTLSKMEVRAMQLKISKGDIITYTQRLIDGFDSLASAKNQRIIFLTKKKNWITNFDRSKWDRIIYNLLYNALKFTNQYGVIQISLRSIKAQEKEWIYLNVRDNGVGISSNELSQIFNRFYQVDDSSTRIQEGMGIGLALVKELIELQGGLIKVISIEEKGTSFEVRLPVQDLVEDTTSQTMPLPPPQSFPLMEHQKPFEPSQQKTTKKKKVKLLLIEDNAQMRDYIQSCIPTEQYELITSVNGSEGIRKAQALIPDLIISDVMMPLKNGFEVVQIIRNQLATSHIPIILLTAKASIESKLEGLRRGADAYLTKPFIAAELILRIEKLIELRQLLQKRYQYSSFAKITQHPITYKEEDVFISRLYKFIVANIDNTNLNGDLIGENFKISRMQLHRKIKALTNQSTNAFIETVRLETAYSLLQQKELNISEIAFQTGFSSPTHFGKKFKKKYQMTPSEVQK